MLYEGNFPEWKQQMAAFFIAKSRPTQAYPSIAHTDPDGTVNYCKCTFGDIEDVLSSITPALKKRIPVSLEVGIGQLYACLENLCLRPLRLLDLPPELRVKIYSEAVTSPNFQGVESDCRPRVKHAIPPLAQSTQLIRREELPEYFAANIFNIKAFMASRPSVRNPVIIGISQWKAEVLQENIKHLRKVDLLVIACQDIVRPDGSLQPALKTVKLGVRFDKARGVYIDAPPLLDQNSKNRLQDLTAMAEAVRTEKGYMGEAILELVELVFTRDIDPAQPNWTKMNLVRVPDGIGQ